MLDSDNAVRRLAIAMNKMDGVYYLCARKLGIKDNTLSLLYALNDGKFHSQKQICDDWLIPKTTLNTVVRELVEAGYIALLPEEHTREKTIALTDSGKAYESEIMRSVCVAEQRAIAKTLQEFSPEFVDALECFANHLCDEIHKQVL